MIARHERGGLRAFGMPATWSGGGRWRHGNVPEGGVMSDTAERPALRRAIVAWREAALFVRGELRAHGVPVDRYIDDAASRRGVGAVRPLVRLAAEARDGGMPREVVRDALVRVIDAAIGPAA